MRTRFAAVAGIAVILGGCSSATAAPPPTGIRATLSEFALALDGAKANAGHVTFTVHNSGAITHEFVIKRSTLQSDSLPLGADGKVDEESPDLSQVDEVEDVVPGSDKPLVADLTPGHYVVFCNLPGHYKAGMHADVEVVANSSGG